MKTKEIAGMQEITPSEEQLKKVQLYKAIMTQVFVRYTPKEERIKWLLPSDDVSEWNVEEMEWIRVYRRGEDIKVEIKYYALPYENFCKDQVDMALTKVLISMSKYIYLDIHFETLMEISMNLFQLMEKYPMPVVKDMRNFMSSFVVEFDKLEMACLPSTIIFHDSGKFVNRENLCVSTISVEETDPEQLEKGKIWKALTLVNCAGANKPGKVDWPPEKYIVLRDQYAKGELKDIDIDAKAPIGPAEILQANANFYKGAHEYCMNLLTFGFKPNGEVDMLDYDKSYSPDGSLC